jgi:hypothetical protein
MKKYMITLHGNPFYSDKYTHNKSGVSYYGNFITCHKQGLYEELLSFTSEREAKLWLLTRSSMQGLKEYMYAIACLPEASIDKLIAKGKYKLSKVMMRQCDIDPSNSSMGVSGSTKHYPLLCEFVITEYDDSVLQQEQGNNVDSDKPVN